MLASLILYDLLYLITRKQRLLIIVLHVIVYNVSCEFDQQVFVMFHFFHKSHSYINFVHIKFSSVID